MKPCKLCDHIRGELQKVKYDAAKERARLWAKEQGLEVVALFQTKADDPYQWAATGAGVYVEYLSVA